MPPPTPLLPPALPITPIAHPINISLAVPGSKSLTNRCLVLGALADGPVTLRGALQSDDTHFMLAALETLGFEVAADWPQQTCRIRGLAGRLPANGGEVFVGAAGTVMRFLSAVVTLGQGRFRLDGTERMRQRPIEDLLEGLRALGIDARSEQNNGCPPVVVQAAGLPGGRVAIDGSRSSQYASALLLVAPCARAPLEVEITGDFVSQPFVRLTLKTMADFGVETEVLGERRFRPQHGAKYRAGEYQVEGDATAASYFFGAAAILGGRCVVTNLAADSAQGDLGFVDVLAQMGCRVEKGVLDGRRGIAVSRDPGQPLRPVDVDLNDMPDVAQTLAAVCTFAPGRSRIRRVGNLRIKETDRLNAVATELKRAGHEVQEGPDWLEVAPGTPRAAEIETYDDHRMAMALALLGLARPGITIKNPACVSKTYPKFFSDLGRLA